MMIFVSMILCGKKRIRRDPIRNLQFFAALREPIIDSHLNALQEINIVCTLLLPFFIKSQHL